MFERIYTKLLLVVISGKEIRLGGEEVKIDTTTWYISKIIYEYINKMYVSKENN